MPIKFVMFSLPENLPPFFILSGLVFLILKLCRNLKALFYFFCVCLGLNFLLMTFGGNLGSLPEAIRTPIYYLDKVLLSPFRLIIEAIRLRSVEPLMLLSISSIVYLAICFFIFKRIKR